MKRFCAALVVLLSLVAPATLAAPAPSDAQIVHLLNRIAYGPAPGDIAQVRRIGIGAYIERQLHPQNMALPEDLQKRLSALPLVNASMQDLATQYWPAKMGQLPPDRRKELQKQRVQILIQLSEARILRAIASPAQLEEVMTDFWFNHFNVFWPKGPDQIFTASYEYDVLRPHALGSFRALLGAVAHAPAMLFYLDNWQDTAPDSPFAQRVLQRRGKQLGINENYAREIMELHTLGVDGGYTQKDVTTLAYILTGWGLARGPAMADKAAFFFDPARHDFGDHVFLGKTVKGGGEGEIEHVLDMLAASPATAHHISYELARYFVADDPPASLVDKVTATYEKTGGNIATMLKVILYSPEFWDPHNAQNKFKPPLRFVVSALRASGVMPQGDTRALQGAIAGMGEPLYRCLTPNGYGDGNDQWLNSDGLLKRIAVAKSFARFFGPQTTATIEATMGNTWTPNTLATVADAPPRLQPALLIGSPEFLYY